MVELVGSSRSPFVEAQHAWATTGMPLAKLATKAVLEVAFDGGGADRFAAAQTAPVDAVQVLLKDYLAKRLTGPLTR